MRPSCVAPQRRQPRRRPRRTPRTGRRARSTWSPNDDRAGQRHHDVDQQPDLHRRKRSRVGAGELEPDEREQSDGRGPVTPRAGIAQRRRPPGRAAAAGRRCAPATAARHTGPIATRQRHQADPQQHVEDAGQRVVAVLRAEHRGDRHPRGEQQPRDGDRPARGGRVDDRRHPLRQRAPGLGRVEARLLPGEGDDGEGERQRPRRADQRVGVRDRQIVRAAEAVREYPTVTRTVDWTSRSVGSARAVRRRPCPARSTVNWNDWPGFGSIVERVLRVGVHVQLVGRVAVDPHDDGVAHLGLRVARWSGVTSPPLMVTSTTSRSGGACWSDSCGMAVDRRAAAVDELLDVAGVAGSAAAGEQSGAAASGAGRRVSCCSASRCPILVGRRLKLRCESRPRRPRPGRGLVAHPDDHADHHDGRCERRDRQQHRVVGEDL